VAIAWRKQVRSARLLDTGGAQVFLHEVREAVLAEGLAELVDQGMALIRLDHELGTHVLEVALQPLDGYNVSG